MNWADSPEKAAWHAEIRAALKAREAEWARQILESQGKGWTMGIKFEKSDGTPVNGKFFVEWFFDLLGAFIVGALVWDIVAPEQVDSLKELGFPIAVTAVATWAALKLMRFLKWIDK